MKKTILLVEDNHSLREITRETLELKMKVNVVEACDGIDALHYLNDMGLVPDLILSDVDMPMMNGLEFAKTVRQTLPSIPILLWSGGSHQLAAKELGVPFFSKYENHRDLVQKLQTMLDKT